MAETALAFVLYAVGAMFGAVALCIVALGAALLIGVSRG